MSACLGSSVVFVLAHNMLLIVDVSDGIALDQSKRPFYSYAIYPLSPIDCAPISCVQLPYTS